MYFGPLEKPWGEWSQSAERVSTARSGDGPGLTRGHPLFMHMKSTPCLSRAEGCPCQVSKPGAYDSFLAEGPVRPRLPLLLVPTSWDTATLEPAHAQHSPHLIALRVLCLQLPLAGSWGLSMAPLVPWLPHLPRARCPFTISREELPATVQQRHAASLVCRHLDLARELSQSRWLPSREQASSVHILAEGQNKRKPWSRGRSPRLPWTRG